MKKVFLMAVAAASISLVSAQPINAPQASPTQTIKQNFGTGSIELSYSRPGKKGREIMGNIEPWGVVWRTGANSATTITFSDDVTIGGKEIKAGKYGLLSIPNPDKFTMIITKDLNVTSAPAYKQENDVVRMDVPVKKTAETVETFTISFNDITNSTVNLTLSWEKIQVSLPISTNTDARVMKQIDDVMNKDNKPYFTAAQYYFDNGKDLSQALSWVNKAAEANKSAYWIHMLKARILAKNGDKEGAKASANTVIELATKAANNGYVLQAKELLSKL